MHTTSALFAQLILLLLYFSPSVNAQGDDDNPVTFRFKCRRNGCCDHHEWCRFWASVGECRTNGEWMAANCQLACATCKQNFRPAFLPRPSQMPTTRPSTRLPLFLTNFGPLQPGVRRTIVHVVQPADGGPVRISERPVGFVTPSPPMRRPPGTTRILPIRFPFRPPVTRPTTMRTTTPRTTTVQATTRQQQSLPATGALAQCTLIQRNPTNAAAMLIRNRLVFPKEDFSGRRPLNADVVVRSNLANACVPRQDEAECQRLLPPVYDNGLSEPVAQLIPTLRPNPRDVNRLLLSTRAAVLSGEYNALLMQFGQFLSHDMAKTTLVPSAKCNVCQNITSRCMAVMVGHEDPNRNFKDNICIRVSRSSPVCGSGKTKPRLQNNENTAYIDASPIYGSSFADSKKFRQGDSAFLKLPMFRGQQALPFDQSKCIGSRGQCKVTFVAGDSRVNLFVGLSTFHTIFTKEHNRIATLLIRLNPQWSADRTFMEARKILGAEIQAIVYREYLPKILGASFEQTVGDYEGYDPNVDATIANEFTSSAFRYGHGMIQEFYNRLGETFANSSNNPLPFVSGTLHSDVLLFEGGIDPLLRGMMVQNVKRPQRLTTSITENMFGSTDLGTINIQRGRDHGHPGYVKYRELCGLGRATTFDHLGREILSTTTRQKLQAIYGTVDRIDLFVGGILEDPVVRGLVGPTIACIVGPQFKRSRDGDRFYYENPGIFTPPQLAEIRKSSLSRIICDNGNDIRMVPREAFRMGRMTPCSQIPSMDLSKWKE